MPDEWDEVREAAKKASDPERLLPGEDLDSMYPDDAEHWIEVYGELLAYKDRLLTVTSDAISRLTEEQVARREVVTTDRQLIAAERERFLRRLDFWLGRLAELKQVE